MRIAFLCSSLEPGRDGVGDYVRGFAAGLSGLGHEVCAVALNDRFVESVVEGEQMAGTKAMRVLRLPANQPWKMRLPVAGAFLDRFQPDWVSLQLVAYGYHPKGLIYGLAGWLKRLLGTRKLHLMAHELWIGEAVGSPLKHRLVGALQCHLIRRLVRTLAPAVMHTSNPAYVAMLGRCGIEAQILPLFGNIEVQADRRTDETARMFHTHGIDLSTPKRDAFWVGAIFGAIHPEWNPAPFFDELAIAAERDGKTVVIVGIGRFGTAGDGVWADTVRADEGRFRFVLLGPQPPETISCLLQAVDFGISTTPWALFGKSGTGAAMLDHGLPVIVTRDDWHPRLTAPVKFNDSPLVVLFERGMTGQFRAFLACKRLPGGARAGVAKTFINSLASP